MVVKDKYVDLKSFVTDESENFIKGTITLRELAVIITRKEMDR